MCALYGLDPRFVDENDILAGEQAMIEALRNWARDNHDEPLRPTGRLRRNLNPILTWGRGERMRESGWWGHLVNGEPARYASINTRAERLRDGPGPLPARAIVLATRWFELQKPQKAWHEFASGELFAMAAVTQPGRTADGAAYSCYSIVTQDSPDALAGVHGRSPVLVPAGFVDEWLTSPAPSRELMDETVARSTRELAVITATRGVHPSK